MEFIAIRDMAAGNESVGTMWQETKIFPENATIEEVMNWAMEKENHKAQSRLRVTLTKPHPSGKNDSPAD